MPSLPLSARLVQLQVLEHRRLSELAGGELRRSAIELVPRGRILDREGRVLAESVPASSAFLDPSIAKKHPRALPKLARALGLDPAELRRKARGPGRFSWLKRKLEPSEVEALKRLELPFVGLAPDERRAHPNDRLAASLLGSVGADGSGLSGLELSFDRALKGKVHTLALLRDGAGRTMAVKSLAPPEPPPDLALTLDRGVQHYAETALAGAVARTEPLWAAVLVQDPASGELLAMASYPPDPLRNRLIQDVYEPGSTFKAVTVAAALEERVVAPGDAIDCAGPWELAPRVWIKDHERYGTLSLEGAMAHSSNIGLAKLGLKVGAERFHAYARAFGFGSRTGVPFPGESPGLLKARRKLDRVSLGNNAFGQGLAVTPLQLLAAFSAIANGGELLEPRLVRSVGGKPAGPAGPQRVRRVASEATIRALGRLLEGVVREGTGATAGVPGFSVAGKTGTSQKLDPATRRYSKTDYVASFAGYVPAKDPRFTILVIVDSPKRQYYGSEVAAPVFAEVARQALALYGVAPDRPLPVRASGPATPRPASPIPYSRAATPIAPRPASPIPYSRAATPIAPRPLAPARALPARPAPAGLPRPAWSGRRGATPA
ncbi:MAG: penicillin-binding protein [Elusimicrobia bacterium]|nr:penicillin-binding protein [Elusimicrobiota bacterium]